MSRFLRRTGRQICEKAAQITITTHLAILVLSIGLEGRHNVEDISADFGCRTSTDSASVYLQAHQSVSPFRIHCHALTGYLRVSAAGLANGYKSMLCNKKRAMSAAARHAELQCPLHDLHIEEITKQ